MTWCQPCQRDVPVECECRRRPSRCERCGGLLDGTRSYWCEQCERDELRWQEKMDNAAEMRERRADTVTGSYSIAEYNRMES